MNSIKDSWGTAMDAIMDGWGAVLDSIKDCHGCYHGWMGGSCLG